MSHKVKDTSGTGYCVAAQPLLWDSRPYFRAVTKAASALLYKMVQKKKEKEPAYLVWLNHKGCL